MESAMEQPASRCPRCGEDLTEVVTRQSRGGMETRIDEPFDAGRCEPCSRMFRRLHSTMQWVADTYAPLCRICRTRELVMDHPVSTAASEVFTCRAHPRQRWEHDLQAQVWTDRGPR